MDRGTDSEVLRSAIDWLHESEAVYLVTVAETWGSAPRRPGALMVIHPDGRFTGSVSGGCVEDALVQRVLRGEFESAVPRRLEFGVDGEAAALAGLPCGGRLALLLERITNAIQLRKILAMLEERRCIARRVCLASGETSLHPVPYDSTVDFDPTTLTKVFGPRWRVLIIGAGELSRRVAQLALTLDYAVTLCDPRPEYAADWQLEGVEFVASEVAQTVARFRPDARSAILALSHSPALDDAALYAALQSEAFYIGALGSRSHQKARRARLQQRGLSLARLQRLEGPVGLDIGSRTPAEIAIAIAGALIAERRRTMPAPLEAQTAHG